MLLVDEEGFLLMNGVFYGVDMRVMKEVFEFMFWIGEDVLLVCCGNVFIL